MTYTQSHLSLSQSHLFKGLRVLWKTHRQGSADHGKQRLPVWKLGLYRPTIGKMPKPHPTQIVFFRDIRKGPARTDLQ
jgi:hypothetical protein